MRNISVTDGRATTIAIAALLTTFFSFGPAHARDATTIVPAGPGQRAVVVKLDGEIVRVRACADPAVCELADGTALRPPESVRSAVASAKVDALELQGGKRAAIISISPSAGRPYVVMLASADKKSDVPRVLFSGFLGRDGQTSTQLRLNQVKGKSAIAVTTRDMLCGAEVTSSERHLDASTLTMKDHAPPDPAGAARAAAAPLTARSIEGTAPRYRILSPRNSSSGRSSLAVDGDNGTAWIEQESSSKARPFLSLGTSSEVPIVGFDIGVVPPADRPGLRAPRSLLVLTDDGAFSVALPEDAMKSGGARFSVALPKPVRTQCVGVVVDASYPAPPVPKKKDPKAPEALPSRTFLSEVVAHTTLDGASLDELAKTLGTADPEAKLKERVLAAEGSRGVRAIIAAYPTLDPVGRDRARRLIDAGACEDKLALYVPLLTGTDRTESDRARDWIRRCGDDAAPALLSAIESAKSDEVRGLLAEEAALVAPELTTKKIVQKLAAASTPEARRAFRKALTKGALRAAGVDAIDATLSEPSFAALGTLTKIDVLRALGPSIARAKNAPRVFAGLAASGLDFGPRYLLLAPASELARGGDVTAMRLLEETITRGDDARLRARAAELAGDVAPLKAAVLAAISDKGVRVRESALLALTRGGKDIDGALRKKLAERFEVDPWTFVRRAAVSALAGAPKDASIDGRIAKAIQVEEQPGVRAEMVRALGSRGATEQRAAIRERAFDDREALSVRLRAIEAMGGVCDRESVDELTELALRGRMPLTERDRTFAAAAIGALVRIQPPDLKPRLAPLLAKGVVPDMRDVTERALKEAPASSCK